MRPMLIVQVLVMAVVIAVVLAAVATWDLITAMGIGAISLLVAAIVGVRQQPPKFRWTAAVGLGGLLTGALLWNLFDYSPFVIRIHNSGSKPVLVTLTVARQEFPTERLAPGQTTVHGGSLGEGSVWLTCDDGAGPRTVDIEGYVTNGMSLTANVDLPTCATAKVSSHTGF